MVLSAAAQNKKFDANRLYSIAYSVKHNGDWVRFKAEKKLPAISLLNDNKTIFGLGASDNMSLVRTEEDDLGMTHYRYQQMYNSIPVECAEYIIHSRNGIAISGNGRLTRGVNINTVPGILPAEAIQKAKQYFPANRYQWEDEGAEEMLKDIRKDPFATYYPSPELVVAPLDFSDENSAMRLAYKMNIYATDPLIGKTVYVDALTGALLFTLELIQDADAVGTAVTRYSGIQTITTDSVAPDLFRLRETGRGGGVETYNMKKLVSYGTAADYTDSNNYWDTTNTNQDQAIPDAHWGAEMTYDYYIQKHNRNSYDNKGTKLVSYVHFAVNYINAFWNGTYMTYGDGNGTSYKTLTSLDIVGHEMTHGVTQNSAGLIYQNESGALNESFSDIFGVSIEHFAKPSSSNWLMADEIATPAFRSMSDPKSFTDPDTYKGQYYYIGTQDYGGVHSNSGVQNFWFYVLAMGDTGTNDYNRNYQVAGIGRDNAAKIAYRNLTVYLGKNSRYIDAREGAICAAEDLFGMCSAEVFETAKAWYAVGVGDPIADNDVRLISVTVPISKCGLTASENISFLFRNRGCTTLSGGDTIFATYRLDTLTIATDTILLPSPMLPGDSLYWTSTKPADFSAVGLHVIDGWINHHGDTLNFNDTIKGLYVFNILYQNTNVAILSMASPKSGCQLSNSEPIITRVQFRGCDSLAVNEQLVVGYRVDNLPEVKETLVVNPRVLPYGVITYTFSTKADFSKDTSYNISSWVEYTPDVIHYDDSILTYRINKPMNVRDSLVTFDDTTLAKNEFYKTTGSGAQVFLSTGAAHSGVRGLQMTGKDWYTKRSSYKTPTDLNTWTANNELLAKVCFCVDARDWSNIMMHFDRRQTYNSTFQTFYQYNTVYTSNLRITVDGTQIGDTYHPVTKSSDQWRKDSVVLDAFAGTFCTVCFETKNYLSVNYEQILNGVGDNAFLDNVYFTGIVKPKIPAVDFNIYPNPASNSFTISYSAEEEGAVSIKIVDILGRVMTNENRTIAKGNNYLLLNTLSWRAGVYVVQFEAGDEKIVKQLVIN